MSGSATFTMVTSTSSMNVPRQTATSGAHLRIGGSFRLRVFRSGAKSGPAPSQRRGYGPPWPFAPDMTIQRRT